MFAINADGIGDAKDWIQQTFISSCQLSMRVCYLLFTVYIKQFSRFLSVRGNGFYVCMFLCKCTICYCGMQSNWQGDHLSGKVWELEAGSRKVVDIIPTCFRFPGESGLSGSAEFSSSSSGRESLRISGTRFYGLLTTAKHWRQPMAWLHPFFIRHWITEGRDVAPLPVPGHEYFQVRETGKKLPRVFLFFGWFMVFHSW